MTLQEHDHFKHYSEQLQLAHDYGKAELWISLGFAPSPILLSTHWYQKVLLTSGFFFVEEFTPVVLRLKQSLWSGHGKNLNLLFFVAWIAFLTEIEVFRCAIEIPSQERSALDVLNYCPRRICQFSKHEQSNRKLCFHPYQVHLLFLLLRRKGIKQPSYDMVR